MPQGLMQQWNLGEPKAAPAGTACEQTAACKADFLAAMVAVEQGAASILINAEEAVFTALDDRRLACFETYQALLELIDPEDPSKAEDAIAALLADAATLADDAASLQKESEQARQSWLGIEPDFESAREQAQEIALSDATLAGELPQEADRILEDASLRRYRAAAENAAAFLPSLREIYDSFTGQQDSQAEAAGTEDDEQTYERRLAKLEPHLAKSVEPSPDKRAQASQKDIEERWDKMDQAAKSGDFETALAMLSQLERRVAACLEVVLAASLRIEDYENRLPDIQSRVRNATQSGHPDLQPLEGKIAADLRQILAMAQAGDFGTALMTMDGIEVGLAAYEAKRGRADEQQQSFETRLAAMEPRLGEAAQPIENPAAQGVQEKIAALHLALRETKTQADYEAGLALLDQLDGLLVQLQSLRAGVASAEVQFETAKSAIQPRLDIALQTVETPDLQAIQDQVKNHKETMDSAEAAQDYPAAMAALGLLSAQLDAFDQEGTLVKQEEHEFLKRFKDLQDRLDKAALEVTEASAREKQQTILDIQASVEAAAADEDFETALLLVDHLAALLDAYETTLAKLADQEKQFRARHAEVERRLEKEFDPEAPTPTLQGPHKEITDWRAEVGRLATAENFVEALELLDRIEAKLALYLTMRPHLEEQKKLYEARVPSVMKRVKEMRPKAVQESIAAQQARILSNWRDLRTLAKEGDFQACNKRLDLLEADLTVCEGDLKRLKAEARRYEAAHGKIAARLEKVLEPVQEKILKPLHREIAARAEQMEGSAAKQDYDSAMSCLGWLFTAVKEFNQAQKDLEDPKAAYKKRWPALRKCLSEVTYKGSNGNLIDLRIDIDKRNMEMVEEADRDSYRRAFALLLILDPDVTVYAKLVKRLEGQKEKFDEKLKAFEPRVTRALEEEDDAEVKELQTTIRTLWHDIQQLARDDGYAEGLDSLAQLAARLHAFEALRRDGLVEKQQYVVLRKDLTDRVAAFLRRDEKVVEADRGQVAHFWETADRFAKSGQYDEASNRLAMAAGLLERADQKLEQAKQQKQLFDSRLKGLGGRLERAAHPQENPVLMEIQGDIDRLRTEAESAAEDGRYHAALDKLDEMESVLAQFDTFGEKVQGKKREYEARLPALEKRLDKATQPVINPEAAKQQAALAADRESMAFLAASEDYEMACDVQDNLETALAAFETLIAGLEDQARRFETRRASLEAGLELVVAPVRSADLRARQTEITQLRDTMDDAATKADFASALAIADSLEGKIQAYLVMTGDHDKERDAFAIHQSQLDSRIKDAAQSPLIDSTSGPGQRWQTTLELQGQAKAAGDREDYEEGLALLTKLEGELAAFETFIQQDQEAREAYERHLGNLEFHLPTLDRPVQDKLARALKQKAVAERDKMYAAAKPGTYATAVKIAEELWSKLTKFMARLEQLEAEDSEG